MIKQPIISVIMSSYNSEKYIGKAIESILSQTYKNFELIIIDDCSKDQTVEIIKDYCASDSRIKLITSKNNCGSAEARNKGIKISKGNYIAIMDSDDVATKDRLKIQLEFLKNNPDIFLLAGSWNYIDENGKILYSKVNNFSPEKIGKELPYKSMIHNPTVMFRNNHSTYYRAKFKYAQDRDLWLRLLSDGKCMRVIPDILLNYRVNPDSVSIQKSFAQKLFMEKAIDFYFQRLKNKKDNYKNFDPDKMIRNVSVLQSKSHTDMVLLKIFFRKFQLKEFRRSYRKYVVNYGLLKWSPGIIYYPVSYMPKKVIKKFIDVVGV